MKIFKTYLLSAAAFALVLVSCNRISNDSELSTGKEIVVGGVMLNGESTVEENATKSSDMADQKPWFMDYLTNGIDVAYIATIGTHSYEEAKLKIQLDGGNIVRDAYGLPIYDFISRSTGEKAEWQDNRYHIFKATCPPYRILEGGDIPENLVTDQHDDSTVEGSEGNYTLLDRYVTIPLNTRVTATTRRVSIPFSRRLCRVLFYILIDPKMIDPDTGKRPHIAGYQLIDGKDDPTTTELRFKRVKVLKQVNKRSTEFAEVSDNPEWTIAPSVIPHFLEERGSVSRTGSVLISNDCVLYFHNHKKYFVTPGNDEWATARKDFKERPDSTEYSEISYGKVPCYDLIMRPTYTSSSNVMYDEVGSSSQIAKLRNTFDVDVELSNGLSMVSEISVDLDPNYQVSVYIRIHPEKVDFDTSVSELWIEDENADKHYGVDSNYPHNMSIAGSTWQRAFRIGSIEGDAVSDSHPYNEDEDGDGQYMSEAKWLTKFKSAVLGGACHGYYFILDNDITINTDALPDDFVFTGHLDAMGHQITLTGSKQYLFTGLNGIYTTSQESDMTVPWEANVHLENGMWVPVAGYRAEILNLVLSGDKLFKTGSEVSGYVLNCRYASGTPIADNKPEIPGY